MARRVRGDVVLVRALNIFTAMQADLFDLQGMLAMGRESLAIAERIDDPALATMAASGLHVLACRAGDREEADAALACQIEHTERARQPLLVFVLANALAFRALGEGRLDEGERLAEDMLEVGSESGQPDALVWMAAHVGILWEEGRRAEEGEALYIAAATVLPTAKAILVRTLAELGQIDRARMMWEELTGQGLPPTPTDLLWSLGMSSLAASAWFLDDPTYAAPLAAELGRLSGELICSGAGFHGAVDHYLGLLAALEQRASIVPRSASPLPSDSSWRWTTRPACVARGWRGRTPSCAARRDDPGERTRAIDLVDRAVALAAERDIPATHARASAQRAALAGRA